MNFHMYPSFLSFRGSVYNQILLLRYWVINCIIFMTENSGLKYVYGLTGVGDYLWSSCGIMVSLTRAQWTTVMFILNNAKARIYVLKAEEMNYIQPSTGCSLSLWSLITTFVASSSFSFLSRKPNRLLSSCNDIVNTSYHTKKNVPCIIQTKEE